jgi:hypothetical protein
VRCSLLWFLDEPCRGDTPMTDNWSTEETDDPLYADRRNFYKVEKWSLEFGNASATNVIARF